MQSLGASASWVGGYRLRQLGMDDLLSAPSAELEQLKAASEMLWAAKEALSGLPKKALIELMELNGRLLPDKATAQGCCLRLLLKAVG